MVAISRSRNRVLLVEPAAVEAHVFSAFGGLPLLGPLILGTLLERAGFEVKVVSENLLRRRLRDSDLDADFLLLSCLTPTVERGYELADRFKARNPSGRVLMGGPHVSFMQQEALEHADQVVVGEAEPVIVELLRGGGAERVVQGRPVEDLDTLPRIDWSLLVSSERMTAQPFMFSRGCPFGCNFCSVTSMFGRRYRTMSVERVLSELRAPLKKTAFFYDDNFAADRARTHAILDGILAGPNRFEFSAQVRADITRDEALLEKMVRAGCVRVFVGFESVDDRALEEMKKGQTAAQVRRAVQLFHKHGIGVHGMFMFGADADDAASVQATSDFVNQARVDSVQFMIFTPFPGTEVYRKLEAEQRLLHRKWRYYDAMHVVTRPRGFTPLELQQAAMQAYGRYYNLRNAAAETFDTTVATLARRTAEAREALGAPSMHNAFLKLVGGELIRRWTKGNRDYYGYLGSEGAGTGVKDS